MIVLVDFYYLFQRAIVFLCFFLIISLLLSLIKDRYNIKEITHYLCNSKDELNATLRNVQYYGTLLGVIKLKS